MQFTADFAPYGPSLFKLCNIPSDRTTRRYLFVRLFRRRRLRFSIRNLHPYCLRYRRLVLSLKPRYGSFQTIKKELQLKDEDVETFIIDVSGSKNDRVNKKSPVTSTMHRTFGRKQWQQLRDTRLLSVYKVYRIDIVTHYLCVTLYAKSSSSFPPSAVQIL
uniref:Uncharacterized protein n=1 Tax=Tetranychus urticae TaxID=32264 RepID=T1JSR3_TETUR